MVADHSVQLYYRVIEYDLLTVQVFSWKSLTSYGIFCQQTWDVASTESQNLALVTNHGPTNNPSLSKKFYSLLGWDLGWDHT